MLRPSSRKSPAEIRRSSSRPGSPSAVSEFRGGSGIRPVAEIDRPAFYLIAIVAPYVHQAIFIGCDYLHAAIAIYITDGR